MGKLTKVDQVQNLSISKAVLDKMGGEGDKMNINYAPVGVTNIFNHCDMREIPMTDIEQMMWTILESLPEPKLHNLKLLAIETVVEKFKPYYAGRTKSAEYLDVHKTYVSKLVSESRKRKELHAAKIEDKELSVT